MAIKTGSKVHLRSCNDNDFSARYTGIVEALTHMPDETVIDGEVVALDEGGRPSFNSMQNYGSTGAPLGFFIFDVLILNGKDVMGDRLMRRRELIEEDVLPKLAEPIRYSPILGATLGALIQSVKAQGLEGLVAKRRDSKYEPGQRSGAWQKMRVNQASPKDFDALVIGYYEGDRVMYAARTRNGFTPASRAELFKKINPPEVKECPFANLPETRAGRWGAGLTSAKMAECRWLKPQLVGQFEFVDWTEDNHLRHSRFVALSDDKKATGVKRK